MNLTTLYKQVGVIALVSLGMALIFDRLFFEKIPGISVFIFVVLLLAGVFVLCKYFKKEFSSSIWLIVPILFFSIMPSIRDSGFLNFLNIVGVMGLLLLLVRSLSGQPAWYFTMLDYIATLLLWPIKFLQRSVEALSILASSSNKSSSNTWKKVLKGTLMALPVLLFFGVLLTSADVAFAKFIDNLFFFKNLQTVLPHLFLVGVIFLIYLGVLAYLFTSPEKEGLSKLPVNVGDTPKNVTDKKIEVSVFLFLIGTLFAFFIGFQITYLFGGNINIVVEGLTYAEYGRRGFWELLVVAFTTLCILLLTDTYTKKSEKRFNWFTIPSIIITAEVLVIIASALKRMMLYQQMYGMTTLRLYVIGFIIFLGFVFLILTTKLLWEKKSNFFTFGTLITAIIFLAGFNILNPDSFIAQKNIARFEQSGKIDDLYLFELSADALPQVLNMYDRLAGENKAVIEEKLIAQKADLERYQKNWQSHNWARTKALEALKSR